MALDPEFRDMFPDRVWIQKPAGRDLYQKPAFGPAVEWIARIVRKQRQYRAPDGSIALSNAQVFIYGRADGQPGLPDLTIADRLILPGGVIQPDGSVQPTGAAPPIVNVNAFPDEAGVAYEVAYLGAQ